MSDMRHYIGTYGYTGKFKESKDGTDLLEVSEFTYYGKYYKPSEPLKFLITPQPEEEGWLWVECTEIGGGIGGVGLKEALGNALMDAALQYEDLIDMEGPMTEDLKGIQNIIRSWEVHAIDSKAQ